MRIHDTDWVVLTAALVLAVPAIGDALRQAELGIADASTWYAAGATYAALAAVVLIGLWPEPTGLSGLSDRVVSLNGRLTVTSLPGGGTTLRAEIPCAC
jgi:hypothetical protein